MMKLHNIKKIWHTDETRLSPARRRWVRIIKGGLIIIDGFTHKNLSNNASALTYSSMLAAVPVLAIVFAVARGFGFGTFIEERIRESMEGHTEFTNTLFQFADSYLDHTHGGVFIGVGLLVLLYTVISLTTNVEVALNKVWNVSASRNVYRKCLDYISIFFLLPIFIVVVSGIRIFLMTFRSILPDYQVISNTLELILKGAPFVLTSLVFILLYVWMPNTKVKLRNAVLPGIVAGLAFQLLQYVYFHYQFVLSSYNAIYGSFAAIPLFMLWLQISWCICLAGAQFCYAMQCTDEYTFSRRSHNMSRRYRDSLRILLLAQMGRRIRLGMKASTPERLSKDTGIPQTILTMLLDELEKMHLVAKSVRETNTHKEEYLPTFDVSSTGVRDVTRRMDSYGTEDLSRAWQHQSEEWNKIRQLRNSMEDCPLSEL